MAREIGIGLQQVARRLKIRMPSVRWGACNHIAVCQYVGWLANGLCQYHWDRQVSRGNPPN